MIALVGLYVTKTYGSLQSIPISQPLAIDFDEHRNCLQSDEQMAIQLTLMITICNPIDVIISYCK